jgi:hypothetical protein
MTQILTERSSGHRVARRRRGSESVSDQIARLAEVLSRPGLESLQRTLGAVTDALEQVLEPSTRRPHRDKGECKSCERDDCHCTCCIGDVDLVVYSRLGEHRIVPITIENTRKREKEIRLELSEFSTRGKSRDVDVAAQVQPEAFTLRPCEEQTVVLEVRTGRRDDDQRDGDVDDCVVLLADLRVEGCDIRPVRIALALLPRECAAYEIECGCGCC